MARLRDDQATDPVHAEAARLVRAVAPREPSDGMKARVRASVRARGRARARTRARLPLALAFLLIGAFAGATVWRGWRERQERIVPPVGTSPKAKRVGSRRHEVPTAEAPALPAELAAPPELEQVTPSVVPAPAARPTRQDRALTSPSKPAPVAEPASPPAASVEAPEPASPPVAPVAAPAVEPTRRTASPAVALLQRAVRALRHDRDARAAAVLADEYLARYSDEDLAEEAYAVAMSAHVQLGDEQAAAIAARYLARFPGGRFRSDALRIQAPH